MRYYELTLLISPHLSEEELKLFQEKIKTFLIKEGGVLVEARNPVKKNLGHFAQNRFQPKTETVYLVSLGFNLPPDKLENLEKKLRPETQILRYLILSKRVPKVIKPVPSRISLVTGKKFEKAKKEKVKLKEIEEKLEEILGET